VPLEPHAQEADHKVLQGPRGSVAEGRDKRLRVQGGLVSPLFNSIFCGAFQERQGVLYNSHRRTHAHRGYSKVALFGLVARSEVLP